MSVSHFTVTIEMMYLAMDRYIEVRASFTSVGEMSGDVLRDTRTDRKLAMRYMKR